MLLRPAWETVRAPGSSLSNNKKSPTAIRQLPVPASRASLPGRVFYFPILGYLCQNLPVKNKKWLLVVIIAFPSFFWLILETSTINSRRLPFYGPKVYQGGKDTVFHDVK